MATAQTSVSLSSHSDLITSLAFSSHPYLATSSLDHTIRVSSLNPATGTWDLDAQDWKAHDSPVLKVTWAHPEFGAVLASGGVDGIVKIWVQEDVRAPATAARTRGGAATTGGPSTTTGPEKRWVQRAALTDARGTIRDIEFAPPDFGLKLAAVSSDSHLRLWECLDPVSMLEWTLVEDIDLGNLPVQPSSATSAGLGAGGLQGQQGGPSPSLTVPADNVASPAKGGSGPSSSGLGPTSLGSAGGSSNVGSLGSSASGSSFDGRRGGTVESDGGWALSWCKEAWWGERLAVSGGNSGIIRLFHLPDHAPWSNYLNLLPPRASSATYSATPPTSSLAWAPASGRSYQLLASGSRDGRARVWKIYTPELEDDSADVWRAEMDAELDESKSNGRGAAAASGASGAGGSVGSVRVEWNVTGTVLSTSGDDAKVRLWKSTYTGQWRPVAVLSTEDAGDDGGMQVDK